MVGLGSSTMYKMVVNNDGSPNWLGIAMLTITFVVVFIWRCMVFIQDCWVGVRMRFGRVVRDANGVPVEYDPLSPRDDDPGKKTSGIRFRFYLLNSIRLVNCGDHETELGIEAVSVGDFDSTTVISVTWNVSRDPGCPTKSFVKPAETGLSWRKSKDELPDLVKRRMADAVVRAYDERSSAPLVASTKLPLLDITDVKEACDKLYEDYGVEATSILYGQKSVSPARRTLESAMVVAYALHDIASSIRSLVKPTEQSNSDDDDKPPALASV